MTATAVQHLGEDTAGPVTEDQHSIYDQLLDGKETVLISVTEKATGKQRAVICGVLSDDIIAGTTDLCPVAMILDCDDDTLLFEPPSDAAVVDPREHAQN